MGMGRGRGGLDEYEAWLDTIDTKFRVVDGELRCDFDTPFSISLHTCNDVSEIVKCAARLREVFLSDSSHLPVEYLLKRFIRIAVHANQLTISKEEILVKLPTEWNIHSRF